MKRIISLLLVAVMIVSMFAGMRITSVADDLPASGSCGTNVTYTFDSSTGELVISGRGAMANYLTYINSPFHDKTEIKSIIINNGVTSISSNAFYGCSSLITVSIPDSVTSIGNYAFSDCTGLTSIDIPDSVTSVGSSAFSNCTGLTSVSIPDSVTRIGDSAFNNCSSLLELSLPTSTSIYNSIFSGGAFKDCTNIEKVTLTKGTGLSRDYSTSTYRFTPWYISRESIKEVVIENGIESIGDYTFYDCTGLTSINIPDSVTSIGDSAFGNCAALNKVNISNIAAWCNINFASGTSNPLGYAHYLYLNDSLVENLTIPTTITTIRNYAFYGCRSIKTLSFSDRLTAINNNAFFGCTEVKDISIPKNVSSIGSAVFNYCKIESMSVDADNSYYDSRNNCNAIISTQDNVLISGCKNTDVPSGVVEIGEGAFGGCTGLSEIVLPDTTTSIDNQAFYACSGLNTIDIKSDNCSIYDSSYTLPSQAIIIINGSKEVYDYAIKYERNYICNHVKVVEVEGKEPTCTEGGWSESSHCSVCDTIISSTDELSELGHDYVANVTEPTCTQEGYTTYICSRCGDNYIANNTEALGHTSAEPVRENEIPATCTQSGSYDEVIYCSVCNAVLSSVAKTIEPSGIHTPAEAVIENEVPSTCIHKGTYDEVVYCSVCNAELSRETKQTEKLEHNYSAVVSDATCTHVGYTTYTCNDCSYSYIGDYVARIEHTPAEAVRESEVPATCTKTGSYDEVVYCSVCNAELSRETKQIAKAAHTPAESVKENEVPATCTKTGSYDEVVYCSVCNAELSRETKQIAKAAHTPAESVKENEVPATCTKTGSYDEVVYCSVCNAELSRETKQVAKLAHTPAEPVRENEVPATCTHTGSYDEVVYCSICNTELSRETKQVAKVSHTPAEAVIENEVPATCKKTGSYDEVVYCSVCNIELSREPKQIAMLEHNYSSSITEPTCTHEGYTIYTCDNCSYSYIGDFIERAEHTYKDTVVEPTTETQGYTVHTCTVCGYSYVDSITDVLPSEMHYIIPSLEEITATLTIKSDNNEYTVSSANGVFELDNIKSDVYRVYAKQKNSLTVCIGEYDTKAGQLINNDVAIPLGDVNGDDIIDLSDVSLLLSKNNYATSNTELDLNNDGEITVTDIAVILTDTNYGAQSTPIV